MGLRPCREVWYSIHRIGKLENHFLPSPTVNCFVWQAMEMRDSVNQNISRQGTLFSTEYLTEAIRSQPEWEAITDAEVQEFGAWLDSIFSKFPTDGKPNESQTEDDLIWPILHALGWEHSLRGQNMNEKGREVPDGLLFDDAEAKEQANSCDEEWLRYKWGRVIVESKRWVRSLDRGSEFYRERTSPAAQMVHYLRRVDERTEGRIRWGILTNGAVWRLYYASASSISEQFLEIDLAEVLGFPGAEGHEGDLVGETRRHWLRVFLLLFRQRSFLPGKSKLDTFHQRALDEGRFYEQRVSDNLSQKVFNHVFPELVRAIERAEPTTDLAGIRDVALVLLYRLLFILYAEDRDLLPTKERRYTAYSLRRLRLDIGERVDRREVFSETAVRYWAVLADLFAAVGKGDPSIGLPPYNGGLFDHVRHSLLTNVRIPDAAIAPVIDALSFERTDDGHAEYINYRSLSVQHLGSVYERLLEFEVKREQGEIVIRPSIFARKGSGSYYTPESLVQLILHETVRPLVSRCKQRFSDRLQELTSMDEDSDSESSIDELASIDPAEAILDLRICDPAMGSGHFLVGLVDHLTDQILEAVAQAEQEVPEDWGEYVSPLVHRINAIRRTIQQNARQQDWTIHDQQLDDRHIVRRMVLKRCVHGVDKNAMAVELAKLSLWLHTFTVGAPLSFLDHHLRHGDSLFGSWVKQGIDKGLRYGSPLLFGEPIKDAYHSAAKMQVIERLTDAEISEAHRSADIFADIQKATKPLDALLSLVQALEWLDLKDHESKTAIASFFDGKFGPPIEVATGKAPPVLPPVPCESQAAQKKLESNFQRFVEILAQANALIEEEAFLNWQVTFPGIWTDWDAEVLTGGFDAVIGNPPWDTLKVQQVEWFADRAPEIARAPRRSGRLQMIKQLQDSGSPLAKEFEKANERALTRAKQARNCGNYPLLSGGDVNLYSLFVERAMMLARPHGMVGLLTPSGISTDKPAAVFFHQVATQGRLHALYDFENGRRGNNGGPFFEDVHRQFKFCVFVASPDLPVIFTRCGFFLHDVTEISADSKGIVLTAADFARVNPNSGTAPIFRSQRDASIVTGIYERVPVLAPHIETNGRVEWPVRYATMFHMANDSELFRTHDELNEQEQVYSTGANTFSSATENWMPLYVGRMIYQFDHRAASVDLNECNLHNTAVSVPTSEAQKVDPDYLPQPQYWIPESRIDIPEDIQWVIGFRNITNATNARTTIASIVPRTGYAHSLPLLFPTALGEFKQAAPLIVANMNSLVFDYVVRTKLHGNNMSWHIWEQLPVVPLSEFDRVKFGDQSARAVVHQCVLELTYTANDLAPFAQDMGHTDAKGVVHAPFEWNDRRRIVLRAKLDAVFFLLYGIVDREDVKYIYSTFPIVEADEREQFDGHYRSCELCIEFMNALEAGRSDADIAV